MASQHVAQQHGHVLAEPRAATSLRGQRWSRASLRLAPWLLITPWLIGLFAITLGPMLASLILSFTDYNLLRQTNWVGLTNYIRMFTDDRKFFAAVGVTVNYVLVSVPLQLAFALAIAVVLNRGLAGLAFYRSMYYLPSLLGSSVAIALLWRQIFGSAGLVNQVLSAIGFTNLPAWIASPDYALDTLILLHVWTFGSPMIIFLAAADSAGPVRGGRGRWRRCLDEILADHDPDAVAGDFLQPGAADDPRVSKLHPVVCRQRRQRRPG